MLHPNLVISVPTYRLYLFSYFVKHGLHLIIQDLMRYLGSPNKSVCMLSKNVENKIVIIFGFSLYAVTYGNTLVIYFEKGLRNF